MTNDTDNLINAYRSIYIINEESETPVDTESEGSEETETEEETEDTESDVEVPTEEM
jgi:hypothetical protein